MYICGINQQHKSMYNIGERIVQQRRKLKITKKQLKERSGVSTQQLLNIENGQNTSISTLQKILDVLKLEIRIVEKEENNELNY